jgi:hypothetical protein
MPDVLFFSLYYFIFSNILRRAIQAIREQTDTHVHRKTNYDAYRIAVVGYEGSKNNGGGTNQNFSFHYE